MTSCASERVLSFTLFMLTSRRALAVHDRYVLLTSVASCVEFVMLLKSSVLRSMTMTVPSVLNDRLLWRVKDW